MISYHQRMLLATALISVALIAYQVAVMQLLSLVQWYHFANMVISIALLGFGAAGSVLAVWRAALLRRSDLLLPLLMIGCGLAMTAVVGLSRSGAARFDSFLLFVERRQWWALLVNYLLFFLPFFLGALALGILFVRYTDRIGRLYFANLIGSGAGALVAAGLAFSFLPATFPVAVSLFAVAAGLLLVTAPHRKWVLPLAATALLLAGYRLARPPDLSLSEYKSLSRTLHLPSARITLQQPGPYGFVQVVAADALRFAPGLSLAYTGEVPVKQEVFNNGDGFGPVVSRNRLDTAHLLDYTTMALPYALAPRPRVLVLQAGTGLEVAQALQRGASRVDAVEPHAGVTDLLRHELAPATDSLFYQPGVRLHVTGPRTYLSATRGRYDLVVLPPVGAFGGGSGLYALQEEYLLTGEALLQMTRLLQPGGAVAVTAWMDYPYRYPLKLAATLAETAEAARLSGHPLYLAAVRSWGTVTFLLQARPFSARDTAAIRRFCDRYYFDPLLLPGLRPYERNFYNEIVDPVFFTYIDRLVTGNREQVYRDYDFHLRPATDDQPYFSQFLRWNSLPRLAALFGTQSASFIELGYLVSLITFFQIAGLAVLLIILPLFRIGWRSGPRGWTLLYFSGLGTGYMFLEIVLIQKFLLFFGNPVTSAALVIGIMMLASGAGSYLSDRLAAGRRQLQIILAVVVVVLGGYTLLLGPLLQSGTGLGFWGKVALSGVLVGLPAFVMGMPFPAGLRLLSVRDEKSVPWAWGVNGCLSVISAAAAALLAVEAGFTVVMLLAAVAYAVAWSSLFLLKA
ncbi:hypothetical protein V9K67_25785 [Paraflavisolibacter sp. H34]|uniref:hypothetical protein n=1 Tax=Huijunlia imazamoxiresistens TaxID=3127457 RepID=UPI00301A5CE3